MVFALLVFSLSYSFFDNVLLYALFLTFSTLLVDIDSKKSKAGRLIVFRPIQWIFSHRGVFHSLFTCFLLSSLLFVFNLSAGFGFLSGYLVHLILDCFSLSGVALFFPFSKKKLRGFVRTGGIIEQVLFVLVLLFDIFLLVKIILKMVSSII
jgi:inner membrane protein